MEKESFEKRRGWILGLIIIMMLQFIAASYFCMQKQGYHYDEYYSYYSTNVTYGLAPTDREWKKAEEIRREFMVLPGEGFNYGMVKLMQTYDVHPPLYYFFLHTICSFFPGVFSKWLGLGLNLVCFIAAYGLFARVSHRLFSGKWEMTLLACLLFGFQPGLLSGITFIRMYMLLLVWCLAITNWHCLAMQEGWSLTPKRVVGLGLLVMGGFLTHYYFAVFLFFLSAFTCFYLWLGRKRLRTSLSYGICVCGGMVLSVLYYPACLGHIFRGYRGTEATGAFFTLSNTWERLDFFTKLMNDAVFGGSFWILLILMGIFWIWRIVKGKKSGKERKVDQGNNQINLGLYGCIFMVTLGYFFVVAKTALLNAEEANRYELPVYGFWILLLLGGVNLGIIDLKAEWRKRIPFFMGGIMLISQLLALWGGEVQFLYPQDLFWKKWAAEHGQETVIYLYHPANTWMIWDESQELMQYEQIYFVNLADVSPLMDEKILNADTVYVYTSRLEEGEIIINQLLENSEQLSQKEKIRELLYCDLYCLE